MHGFVVDDGVAAFRPVELVSLRASSPPWLRYCGCATYFDPPAEHVATMRAAVQRVGEHLRATVGFRGAFTLDGISSADGWVATECNPRFGAALSYLDTALPELCMVLLHHAVVEGVGRRSARARSSARWSRPGARTRWGGAWTSSTRPHRARRRRSRSSAARTGFRRAVDGEAA